MVIDGSITLISIIVLIKFQGIWSYSKIVIVITQFGMKFTSIASKKPTKNQRAPKQNCETCKWSRLPLDGFHLEKGFQSLTHPVNTCNWIRRERSRKFWVTFFFPEKQTENRERVSVNFYSGNVCGLDQRLEL